jgi:hypothetical protein
MVNANHDSTEEVIIQRTINGIQRMISLHNNQGEIEKGATKTEAPIQISLAAKRHWESEIKILQKAPRDPENLRKILKEKQEEYEKATDSDDIERLVPEIEMLQFVLFLVCRNLKNDNSYLQLHFFTTGI